MLALLSCSASGLVFSPAMRPAVHAVRPPVSMAAVDEFTISKDIKCVRIFEGDYSVDLCDEVAAAGTACIANKGSFSLCIPGGSVVAALAKMPTDAFDFTKMHVFFANEKIPSYPCLNGALEITKALGVPEDQARHCQQSAASPDTSTSMSAYVTATASA